MNIFEQNSLPNWPSYAKLFVGLFVFLMLCVSLWAVFIYTVEKGTVEKGTLPPYMQGDNPHSSEQLEPPDLRENVGLAHTHINGQTLLYFALGFIFLFTTISEKKKKQILILLTLSILIHAIGLSGEGFHWLFDDILALSGIVMLALFIYMLYCIVIDLGRTPKGLSK